MNKNITITSAIRMRPWEGPLKWISWKGGGAFNTIETSFFLHFELQEGYRMVFHIYLGKVFFGSIGSRLKKVLKFLFLFKGAPI